MPEMKTSFLILSVMVLLASIAELTFTVKVDGAEQKDVLTNGLKPSELAPLTIHSNNENLKVLEFEIIHARGESPLSRGSVTQGNTFDLSKFRDKAKTGDRIVISVTKITGDSDKLTKKNSVLQIPIR